MVHAVAAYLLDSKLVLGVALTSFAAWLGVEASLGSVWDSRFTGVDIGYRALACALVFFAAKQLHQRLGSRRDFLDVFDHFAANFAFWGALALVFDGSTRWAGAGVLLALAISTGVRGFRQGRETFVLYTVGYGAIGLWSLEEQLIDSRLLTAVLGLATVTAAVLLLWRLRARMRQDPP